jgi:hypothetical protein
VNPFRPLARRLGRAPWAARTGRWLVPVDAALQRRTNGRLGLVLTAGDERDRQWRLLTTTWPAYDDCADRAGRDIRVFLLTPAED